MAVRLQLVAQVVHRRWRARLARLLVLGLDDADEGQLVRGVGDREAVAQLLAGLVKRDRLEDIARLVLRPGDRQDLAAVGTGGTGLCDENGHRAEDRDQNQDVT